jgi:hypothetical protein
MASRNCYRKLGAADSAAANHTMVLLVFVACSILKADDNAVKLQRPLWSNRRAIMGGGSGSSNF